MQKCDICDGIYQVDKHNFDECFSLDAEYDIIRTITIPSPCIKWVGGKHQLLSTIGPLLENRTFDTYYEPFVGGGSVLLMVINMIRDKNLTIKKLVASDINWQLICMYNTIKNNPIELMSSIDAFMVHYTTAPVIEYKKRHSFDILSTETVQDMVPKGKNYVYYYFRKLYNEQKTPSITAAALFIILNKLCFRGVYRESKNGFNVPYGNYIKPGIYNKNNILAMNYVFNYVNVTFKHQSWDALVVTDNDIVYMDPPYYPIRKKAFEGYNKNPFNHSGLMKYTHTLKNFIQSNAWCDFIVDGYKDYPHKKIQCRRFINAKNPSSTDYEIIVFSKSLQPI